MAGKAIPPPGRRDGPALGGGGTPPTPPTPRPVDPAQEPGQAAGNVGQPGYYEPLFQGKQPGYYEQLYLDTQDQHQGTQDQPWTGQATGNVGQPRDMNMAQPGYYEQLYLDNPYNAPGNTAGYVDRMQGQYEDGPGLGNYSEQIMNDNPGGGILGDYYDREAEKATARMNNWASGMGMVGGSAHADALSGAMADLFADKAFRSADFDLRAAEQADRSAQDAASLGLDYMDSGLDAAGEADAAYRDDFETEGGAALTAQNAKEGRVNTLYDKNVERDELLADLVSQGYDAALLADLGLLDSETEAELGGEAADVENERSKDARFDAGVENITKTAETLTGKPKIPGAK